MKYLENLELENLSNFLSNKVIIGGRILNGRIELYSTKRAGDDKKQSKVIEQRILAEQPSAPTSLTSMSTSTVSIERASSSASSSSNIVPSTETKSAVKLHVDLVQTLNASLIDYDFSELGYKSFKSVEIHDVVRTINNYLAEITAERPNFLTNLWREVDAAIGLSNCEAFCLPLPDDSHPYAPIDDFGAGVPLWSFIYLFHNKELRRICLFTCYAATATFHGAEDDDDDDMSVDEDEEGNDEMDDSSSQEE